MRTAPLAFALLLAFAGCGGGPSPQTGNVVVPWFIGAVGVVTNIKAGASVSWQSTDFHAHTSTSTQSPATFAEQIVAAGATSTPLVFNTPGSYPYICRYHGTQQMNGTVVVSP